VEHLPKRSVTEVFRDITRALEQADTPLTTREIAKSRGLDQKTAEKYLGIMRETSAAGRVTLLKELPRMKLWSLEPIGLLSLPEKEQTRIIRKHFPRPSAEEKSMVKLLLANSTEENRALKTRLPASIVKAGWVKLARNGVYLTEEGSTIARGALRTYPELRSR